MVTEDSRPHARILLEYMDRLASDAEPPPIPDAFAEDPEFLAYHQKMLCIREAVACIAKGDLTPELTASGFLADNCKTLQANLRHLIWKVQQVEQGDYSHRINFLGEFSTAFNNMVVRLEKSIEALRQKEEVLVNLAKSLQDEARKHAQRRIGTLRELQRSQVELRYQAQHDPLTGILNRRSFSELVEKKLCSAVNIERPSAICMLDIDYFKRFNDTYGHLAGDDALKHVVAVSASCLRDCDCMGRYGGEEFVYYFAETNMAQAEAIAERIRATLATTPVRLADGTEVPITASLGVCVVARRLDASQCPYLLQNMMDQADKALYVAKNQGRNRVFVVSYVPVRPANGSLLALKP